MANRTDIQGGGRKPRFTDIQGGGRTAKLLAPRKVFEVLLEMIFVFTLFRSVVIRCTDIQGGG